MDDYDNARRARQLWAAACREEQRIGREIVALERKLEKLQRDYAKVGKAIAEHDRWFRGYSEEVCEEVAREIPKPVWATKAEVQHYYRVR